MIKTYSELIRLPTFEQRFAYLRLNGRVGEATFGYDRVLNQVFYRSPEWRTVRRNVIARDLGQDLACEGYDIFGHILVHHINPITLEDIAERSPKLFDMDNLITTQDSTHKAIHFGDESLLFSSKPTERRPNDMCPWR